MMLEQLDIHKQKNEVGLYLMPSIKINSKWTEDLNTEAKAIKLSGDNIGINCGDLGLGKAFLEMPPKAQWLKKIGKEDFIERKNICVSEDIKKMKKHTEWKKMFANDISDKGLISVI